MIIHKRKRKYFNREISWLAFNQRVLQETMDPAVPIYEKLKFVAIFSSNLEEFYRVRVAGWRYLLKMVIEKGFITKKDPDKVLRKIRRVVQKQMDELGFVFRNIIIPELNSHKVFLISEHALNKKQAEAVDHYFKKIVRPLLKVNYFEEGRFKTFIKTGRVRFVVKLTKRVKNKAAEVHYALLNIPSDKISRFFQLPQREDIHEVIYLDDIIRLYLDEIFQGYEVEGCYSFKLTRDGELYLEEEFEGQDIIDELPIRLERRKKGVPTRCIYDARMPKDVLLVLRKAFKLTATDLLQGGRYNKLSDFFKFPNPENVLGKNEPLPPLPHKDLETGKPIMEVIKKKDILIHYPYQRYDYFLDFLEEAALDPRVTDIKITIYRLADDSEVINKLKLAAENGKSVTAFIELKARFDEKANLYWFEVLKSAGVEVHYSGPKLKVHCKLCQVTRKEGRKLVHYVYTGTGNFHEGTAKLYGDDGLFTVDPRITNEVEEVFKHLSSKEKKPIHFEHLLVAPDYLRDGFMDLVDHEINNAREGKKAEMILKMNSLEDPTVIDKLYEASNAGVEIILIIRGLCCLIPGVKGMSKNIKVYSIVNRFLEHSRAYLFHHDGEDLIYLSSADWMKRNLSKRIEVAFPIYDPELKAEMIDIMRLQLKDNTKARIINQLQTNPYKKSYALKKFDFQLSTYDYLERVYKESLK